ncbi:MAG: tRNA (adenosine(37)-N6)-threonylcarbamoyltransferase complex transferase subunit TsaD [Candidatus Moraniibacteriota bacterium]
MSTLNILKPALASRRLPKKSKTVILSIETSCDETAISILAWENKAPVILSNKVSSQIKLHAKWGGVVPNLAARQHVKNIDHVLKSALAETAMTPANIDVISVTNGPGLIPALLVGVNYAKTLAYLWEKPLIGIHHIEGHIYANFISDKISAISNFQFPISKQIKKSQILNLKRAQNSKEVKNDSSSIIENCELKIENSEISFPVLTLVVSGGHTQLILMKNHLQYEIIGQTVDDAVGEAFDKVARILGIGYPGGPNVAAWAAKFRISNFEFRNENNSKIKNSEIDSKFKIQNSKFEIHFPRPMLNKQGFNFSFSGLKTAVLYEVKKFVAANGSSVPTKGAELPREYITEICHEFQQACIDVLVSKTIKAAQLHQPKTIMLAGGVSANLELRKQLNQAITTNLPGVAYRIPSLSLTGDNGAMIGSAGAFRWEKMSTAQKKSSLGNWKNLQPNANLKMK